MQRPCQSAWEFPGQYQDQSVTMEGNSSHDVDRGHQNIIQLNFPPIPLLPKMLIRFKWKNWTDLPDPLLTQSVIFQCTCLLSLDGRCVFFAPRPGTVSFDHWQGWAAKSFHDQTIKFISSTYRLSTFRIFENIWRHSSRGRQWSISIS